MSLRREAAAILRLVTGNAAFLVGGLATNVVVAKLLGAEEFGRFGILLSVATVASVGVMSGVPHLVSLHAAARPEQSRATVARSRRLQAGVTAALAAALLAASWPLGQALQMPWGADWAIAAGVVLGFGWFYFGTAVLNGLSDSSGQALALGGSAALRLLLAAALAAAFGVAGALAGIALALVLAAALAELRARPRLGDAAPDGRVSVRLADAAPVIAGAVAVAVATSADVLIVGRAASAEAAGHYFAASTLARVPYYGAMAISSVYYAATPAAPAADAGRLVARAAAVALALACPAAAALAAAGRPLLALLYGDGYTEAAVPMAVLAAGFLAAGLAGLLGAACIARRRFWLPVAAQGAGAVAVLAVGIPAASWDPLLGPALGLLAGAVASLALLAGGLLGRAGRPARAIPG